MAWAITSYMYESHTRCFVNNLEAGKSSAFFGGRNEAPAQQQNRFCGLWGRARKQQRAELGVHCFCVGEVIRVSIDAPLGSSLAGRSWSVAINTSAPHADTHAQQLEMLPHTSRFDPRMHQTAWHRRRRPCLCLAHEIKPHCTELTRVPQTEETHVDQIEK